MKRWWRIHRLLIERWYLMIKIDFLEQDILGWMDKHKHLSIVPVELNEKYLSDLETEIIKVGERCDEIQTQLNAFGYFSYK